MKTLISFIGNSDPIRGDYDGPMLHITRHYRPDKVILLLTKRMQVKERIVFLNQSLQHLAKYQSRKIDVDFINLDVDNPADFINFGFTSIFDEIYQDDDEFLVNITSGTPQMIAAMCLEIVTNNRKVKTIQVHNPNPKSKVVEAIHEFEYDFEQNLDNLEEALNRCVITDIYSFKIAQQKQILQNKILAYDYEGALEVIQSNPYIQKSNLFYWIEYAYHCDKLRNIPEKRLSLFDIQRSKSTKRVNNIVHYYLSWELENKRNDHISTILRITPILYELAAYILLSKAKPKNPNLSIWEYLENDKKLNYNLIAEIDPDLPKNLGILKDKRFFASTHYLLQIFKAFDIEDYLDDLKQLRDVEENERNHIAHQIDLTKLDMNKIKTKSNMSVKCVKNIITQLFSNYLTHINLNFFEDINQRILDIIKETEE